MGERTLEVREDFAHNRWQFAMTQWLRLKYLDDQKIGAEGWVTREMFESMGKREAETVIRGQLSKELDRVADAVFAYDEAYGEAIKQEMF